MNMRIRAILLSLPFLAVLPNAALAQLACDATVSDINFGEVSVRGAGAPQTIGDVQISCSGGVPGSTANVCLFLGPGSGGAAAGNSPRYIRRLDGESLAYQLRSGSFSGPVWDNVGFQLGLDTSGAGRASAAIYAEVTSQGQDVEGGDYTSTFSGPGQVELTYGEADCLQGSSTPGAFSVTAHIVPSCSLTVGNLDFGRIATTIENPVHSQANISITCSSGAPYSVTLGPGYGPGVTDPRERKMTNGADALSYGLYHDPGNSSSWGWSQNVDDHQGTGTGSTQSLTVYGRINPGQTPNVGTYSDSVVVTVIY